MLRTGRVPSLALAWLAVAAVLMLPGCASQRADDGAADARTATGAAPASGPVVLTGATFLTGGGAPKLLLSGAGPLSPTIYSRDGGRTIVVDLADTVPSPGLEPPRADGTLLAQVGMRSFSELGHPHLQFELTGRGPLDSSLGTETGGTAMAIQLVRREEPASAPATRVAEAGGNAPAAPLSPEPEVKSEPLPTPVVVKAALPSEPSATAPASFPTGGNPLVIARHEASGSAATKLAAVSAKRSGGGAVVSLGGDGDFAYEAFTLGNPPRFVLDLSGVRNVSRVKARELDSGPVSRVRVSQFRSEPSPVTRVVFDLNSEVLPEIMSSSAGLAVRFVPATSSAPVVQLASAAGPANGDSAAPASGSYESHEESDVHEPVVTAGNDAEAATAPTAAAAATPAPVAAAPAVETSAAPVSPAPAAEPAAVPAEATASQAPAEASGKSVPGEAPSAPVAAAEVAKVAETTAVRAEQPPAGGTEPRAAVQAAPPTVVPAPASPEVKEVKQVRTAQATPAAPSAPRSAQKAPPRRKATAGDDRLLMEAAETLLDEQEKASGARDLANSYESRSLGGGERQYTGEPLTLNLKDADIKDTLQKFSELTNLNIVLDPDVRGTVTVSLNDIPWDQALELILKINGLGYVLEGNVMRIAPTTKLAAEEQARQALARAQEQNKPTRTVIQKLSYAPASTTATTVRKIMSPRGDIFVDDRSNTLIIKELPEYLPTVLDLIKNLDAPVPQVMIEARVVEATRTFLRQLGIDWSFRAVADQSHGNTTGLVFPNNGSVTGTVALANGSQVLGLSLGNVLDTFRLDMKIQAAESQGLVKLVSSPKIQTQTNHTAQIQSGFQIPVQTTVNNTTTVLYVDATLRLNVTPQITAENTIIMDIQIQRREPASGLNIAGGQNVPLITRDAQTRLMVRDGGTAVIGGIFKLTANDGQSMIPGLWKIPLLGNLFRNKTTQQNTDELMIFITPRIMKGL